MSTPGPRRCQIVVTGSIPRCATRGAARSRRLREDPRPSGPIESKLQSFEASRLQDVKASRLQRGSWGASASGAPRTREPRRADAGKISSGRNERPFISPTRPPRTSTHSSPEARFRTWATKTQRLRRSLGVLTTTASPSRTPCHEGLRTIAVDRVVSGRAGTYLVYSPRAPRA